MVFFQKAAGVSNHHGGGIFLNFQRLKSFTSSNDSFAQGQAFQKTTKGCTQKRPAIDFAGLFSNFDLSIFRQNLKSL